MTEETKIRLRAVEPEDVNLLYEWENQMEIWTVGNTITPFSRAVLEKYVKHASLDIYQTKQLRLMIDIQKDENVQTIGMLDLFDFDPYHSRAGVGILINKQYRQQGYAGGALKQFIKYCFEQLGLHQLYCSITSDNEQSIKLFEAHGFKRTGVKHEWRKTSQGYKDEIFFQLIAPATAHHIHQ